MTPELTSISGDLNEQRDPIAAIQAKLRKYPQARADISRRRVVVHPPDESGFEVCFHDLGGRYQVFCGGWHEEFTDAEAALNCFAFSLSTACRLKVWRRGGVDYRWQLEALEAGRWIADGVVGLLLFPFWRRREVLYLQNRLLEAA
jgi:hypothetical protein